MPKKTNKTSHVLSLLTNGADPEEISGQDLSGERNTKKQEKAGTEAAPMDSVQKVSSSGDKMVVVVDDQEENISNKILMIWQNSWITRKRRTEFRKRRTEFRNLRTEAGNLRTEGRNRGMGTMIPDRRNATLKMLWKISLRVWI